jgi:hypothetical protein
MSPPMWTMISPEAVNSRSTSISNLPKSAKEYFERTRSRNCFREILPSSLKMCWKSATNPRFRLIASGVYPSLLSSLTSSLRARMILSRSLTSVLARSTSCSSSSILCLFRSSNSSLFASKSKIAALTTVRMNLFRVECPCD